VDYDVFLPGDYFFDLIYTGLPEFPVLGREIFSQDVIAAGGALYITAASLTRLGIRTGWAGCFGSDYYSRYVLDLAVQEGLDLALARQVDRPYRRVTTSIPYQGERAFVTYADPPPLDLNAFWLESMQRCRFKHLHLGGLLKRDQLTPLVAEARRQGATISMDSADHPYLREACDWGSVLGMVDIFMPNAREAMIISGTSAVQAALEQLMQWARIVIVKDGANGAWIGAEGKILHAPAINAGPVVDTTGAGDCFTAGVLLGYVVEQAPLERCARYGNICGGLSVTRVGGATAAPTRAQLEEWLNREAGAAG